LQPKTCIITAEVKGDHTVVKTSTDLSPTQASLALGVSRQTILAWVARGKLQGTRTVLGLLVSRESVEDLLEERKARPEPAS
jgi:excisionase family DNA binding protein